MLQKLEKTGISPLPAAELDDATLHARLWQLIEFIAGQGTYLSDTDHLSDRELYEWLLEQAADAGNDFPGMGCFMSPIGSCDAEDMQINFRFFADDKLRASWMEQFPDYIMPPRETPPYSRDHLLPQGVIPHMMFDKATGEWKIGRLEDGPAYWEELEDETKRLAKPIKERSEAKLGLPLQFRRQKVITRLAGGVHRAPIGAVD